jgi:hypothetical protein
MTVRIILFFISLKINLEFNVFNNIHTNWLFISIIIFTIIVQAIIVEFGSTALATTGLDVAQWFSCIGIALLSLPYGNYNIIFCKLT